MGHVHRRYARVTGGESREALGQLDGSENLEEDIALCPLQTIEPYFLKYLPQSGKILEAGSGRGRWVFYLRRKGFDVLGIDIAESDVAFAKAYDEKVPISHGNVLDTGFADGSFAAVISLGVVEHFEEGPQQAFRETRRILKPGGLFLVTVPTQNVVRVLVFNRIKDALLLYRRSRGRQMVFEEYRYSRRQFEMLLLEAGFEIIERAPDEFVPPKNMGLYKESRFLQHPTQRWELNRPGKAINGILSRFSLWLHCGGTLWVCRA